MNEVEKLKVELESGFYHTEREEMTNEEAIAIIRKEYLCVDRDCDIERSCGKCDLMMPSKEPILEAYKVAIKALEQEPCDDATLKDIFCMGCEYREQEPKWDRLYSWLNDMRFGIAPDETTPDDERNERLAQVDVIDDIMEWIVEPQESEEV